MELHRLPYGPGRSHVAAKDSHFPIPTPHQSVIVYVSAPCDVFPAREGFPIRPERLKTNDKTICIQLESLLLPLHRAVVLEGAVRWDRCWIIECEWLYHEGVARLNIPVLVEVVMFYPISHAVLYFPKILKL